MDLQGILMMTGRRFHRPTLVHRLVEGTHPLRGAPITNLKRAGMSHFQVSNEIFHRRAHLRTCMEALKEHLVFDSEVPRITMLTVLKKATATIQVRTYSLYFILYTLLSHMS